MPAWTCSATSEPAGAQHKPAGLAPLRLLRAGCFLLCSGPACWLLGAWLAGALGANPLSRLLHVSGRTALLLLLLALAVSPLRRLSVALAQQLRARFGKRMADWNLLIRLRRQLGLFSCFYASLHLALYAALDAGLDPQALAEDLRERSFIVLGWVAWGLLLPLAATSNRLAMRSLGPAWRRLHQLSYPAAALGVLHFALQAKVGQGLPWLEIGLLALLLAARVRAWLLGERQAAAEVQRSPRRTPT